MTSPPEIDGELVLGFTPLIVGTSGPKGEDGLNGVNGLNGLNTPPVGSTVGNMARVGIDGGVDYSTNPDARYAMPTFKITGGATPGVTDATSEVDAVMAAVYANGGNAIILVENDFRYVGGATPANHVKNLAYNTLKLRAAMPFAGLSNVHIVGARPGIRMVMDVLDGGGNGTIHAVYFAGQFDNVGVTNIKFVWPTRPAGRGLGDAVRFLGFPGAATDATWGWAPWSTPQLGAALTVPQGTTAMTLSVSINGGSVQTTSSITTLTAAGIQTALAALSNVGNGNVTVTLSGTVAGLYRVVFPNAASNTANPVLAVVSSTGATVVSVAGVGGITTGPGTRPYLINTSSENAPGVGAIFMGCERIGVVNHTTTDTFADGLHFNCNRTGTVTGYRYTNQYSGHGNGDDSLPFVCYYDPLSPASSPEGPFNQPSLGDWSNDGIVATGLSIDGGRASGIRLTGCRNVVVTGGKVSRKGVGVMANGTILTYTLNTHTATSLVLTVTDQNSTAYTTSSITDLSASGIQAALGALSYVGVDNVNVTALGGTKFTVAIDPDVGTATLTVASSSDSSATVNANSGNTSASQACSVSNIAIDNCGIAVSVQTNTDITGTEAFWHFDLLFKALTITRSKKYPWYVAGNATANGSIYGVRIEDCTSDVDASLGCLGSVFNMMRGHIRGLTQACLNSSTANLTIRGQGASSANLAAQNAHRVTLQDVWVTDGGTLTIKDINDLTVLGRVGSRNANTDGVSVTNVQSLRGSGEFVAVLWNRANDASKSAAGFHAQRVKNASGTVKVILENDTHDVGNTYNSVSIGGGNATDLALFNVQLEVEYRTTMDTVSHTTGDDVLIQAGTGTPNEFSVRQGTFHGGTASPVWAHKSYSVTTKVLPLLHSVGVPGASLKAGAGTPAVNVSSPTALYLSAGAGTWNTA